MNKNLTYAALVVAGALVGVAGYALIGGSADGDSSAQTSERKPLYWQAPMNPDFRSDKPGKSPMGMDLVAVYADDGAGGKDEPGTIRISPDIVNNLGVTTAQVQAGRLVSDIKTVGYVQYDEDQLVHIHPRVEGWIEKLYVKAEGDPVEKGAALYEIYSPNLVNAQEELVLALNRNNPGLIQAAEDRLKSLQVPASAIRAVRQSRKVSQTVTVYTPQSGVIDDLNVREGFFVKPGTNIMSIGVLDEVWVAGEIFERQASMVQVGDPVVMSMDYLPGESWNGRVDYVYPTVNLKTRTAKVRVRLDNPGHRLKPGMFAQLLIKEIAAEEHLLVPVQALIRTGSQNRLVLALGDGKFKSVEVKIGRVGERRAEILQGVNEGEYVVTSAQFLLDSESSKTSDFKRMNVQTDSAAASDSASATDPAAVIESVWVQATINTVMAEHRMLNVTHQPVDEWGWPSMTMDFTVDESVDMNALANSMNLEVKISKGTDQKYRITGIRVPDGNADPAEGSDQSMQNMKHEEMDPAQQSDMPDHQSMQHAAMESGHD